MAAPTGSTRRGRVRVADDRGPGRARRPLGRRATAAALVAVSVVGSSTAVSAAVAPPPRRPVTQCPVPGNGYRRMFPQLPAASWDTSAVDALAAEMVSTSTALPVVGQRDAEENVGVAAGYTYFGQFVDHDITSDDRTNTLGGTVDPATLVNGRTPQLDLDQVYGSGPTGSAQLYEADGMHLRVGSPLAGSPDAGARDLPRSPVTGMAVVGDLRDDENRMVAAVHSSFLRLHNRTVDRVRAAAPAAPAAEVFARARAEVVRGYQTVVLEDLLVVLAGRDAAEQAVATRGRQWYSGCMQMPVEFSVAAYRVGHSMVRSGYRLNSSTPMRTVFSGDGATDLSGFHPATDAVDWNLFVPATATTPAALRPAAGTGDRLVQWAYLPDASLTSALGRLPLPPTDLGAATLARRNLLRGRQLGLPSGQDVARAMGVSPLSDAQLSVGVGGTGRTLAQVDPSFAGKAPLWAYVQAESAAQARAQGARRGPVRLGPVGGRIVASTLVGLVASDPSSVLNSAPPRPYRGQAPVPHRLRELLDRAALG